MKMIIDDTQTYLTEVENRVTTLIIEPFYTEEAVSDADQNTTGFSFVIGNGDDDIAAGFKLFEESKVKMDISSIKLMGDAAGSIVLDIWNSGDDTIPTVADTITATSKPTLSSEQIVVQTVFVGWTVGLDVGDTLGFNVDSVSGLKQVTVSIRGTRTAS
jgi:hypothetical protein